MKRRAVIDCSFILSHFLPDEKASAVDLEAYTLYVPSLFFLECANVLQTVFKKGRLQKEDVDEYLFALMDLPLQVDLFSASAASLPLIARLGVQNGLTAYDASYLELAIRLGSSLGTYDKALKNACLAHKVDLL